MEKHKILVVEDEKDTRYLLTKLLTVNNFEVLTAENGKEALDVLEKDTPAVIVADWMMPVMDGLKLCKTLKSDDNLKLIYFIILTARASLGDRITGLDVGADDFLVKPVENQELLARIRTGIRINNLQLELKNIEQNKALLAMACTLGHKINNPLSSLLISVKNIEDELIKLKKTDLNDDLKIINLSVEKISILVKDLINLQNPEMIDYTSENKMLKLS